MPCTSRGAVVDARAEFGSKEAVHSQTAAFNFEHTSVHAQTKSLPISLETHQLSPPGLAMKTHV